jgi:hypothetical protein
MVKNLDDWDDASCGRGSFLKRLWMLTKRASLWLILIATMMMACGRPASYGSWDEDVARSRDVSAPDLGSTPGLSCPDMDIGSRVGTITGSTRGRGNDFSGSCVAANTNGGEDVTLQWTAPRTGRFFFSTVSTSYNTVLYALDGGCAGRELACNDDRESARQILWSWFELSVSAGQTVLLVVDGYDRQASGDFALTIGESMTGCVPNCAGRTCGPDGCMGTCGTCSAGQACDTNGRCVVSGECVPGQVRACYSGAPGTQDVGRCRAGAQRCEGVGEFGNWGVCTGDVTPALMETCGNAVDDNCNGMTDEGCMSGATCAARDLGSAIGDRIATGSTVGAGSSLTSTICATMSTAPEVIFRWTAPSSGTFTFTTVGSTYDTVLYARRGACAGLDVGCDDDSGGAQSSLFSLALSVGDVLFLVVDGFGTEAGNYVLNIRSGGGCVPNCAGRTCGPDGCTGTCGTCPAGQTCDTSGRCTCVPNCAGRVCGDNGCGGFCGACPSGSGCDASGPTARSARRTGIVSTTPDGSLDASATAVIVPRRAAGPLAR